MSQSAVMIISTFSIFNDDRALEIRDRIRQPKGGTSLQYSDNNKNLGIAGSISHCSRRPHKQLLAFKIMIEFDYISERLSSQIDCYDVKVGGIT